ncbi:MAG TPA: ATP-binding protein [Methanotrichaceae archaeon]|nr:ATP-binding protein [Methanotrichaceae archaeon]
MTQKREITLAATVDEFPRAAEFVEEILTEAGFSMKKILEIQLAVEEACTNVINYGYEGGKGIIHITTETLNDHLVMTIEDEGIQFDPTKVDEPSMTDDVDEKAVGGMGVHLIRSFVEDLKYEFVDGKNTLTLIVKRE